MAVGLFMMQPAYMPETPLARGLDRFFASQAHGKEATDVGHVAAFPGAVLFPDVSLIAAPSASSAPPPPARPMQREETISKVEKGRGPSKNVLEGLTEPDYVNRLESMNDGVTTYRSVDATGRVWGAPNAGGSRQCADCPAKAKGTALRCVACEQKRLAMKYPAMAPADLELLTSAVGKLLSQQTDPEKRASITKRTDVMFAKLKDSKLEPDVQNKLLVVANAVHNGEDAEASQHVAALASQDWKLHKAWIIGLCQLVSHASVSTRKANRRPD